MASRYPGEKKSNLNRNSFVMVVKLTRWYLTFCLRHSFSISKRIILAQKHLVCAAKQWCAVAAVKNFTLQHLCAECEWLTRNGKRALDRIGEMCIFFLFKFMHSFTSLQHTRIFNNLKRKNMRCISRQCWWINILNRIHFISFMDGKTRSPRHRTHCQHSQWVQ